MAKAQPKPVTLAVLITCCNDAPDILVKAVNSVLQSAVPLHLYVVDDGSKVPVSSLLAAHPNLFIHRFSKNVGLPVSPNYGLEWILSNPDYKWIARLDADDISMPERFARQIAFLEENPEIALVGSWAEVIEEKTEKIVFHFNPPTAPAAIARALQGNSCILHPSWMVRAEVFRREKGYNKAYTVALDYEFLARLSHKGYKLAQLPEYLIKYRISPNGISVSKRRRQLNARLRIQLTYFRPFSLWAWLGVAKTLLLYGVPMGLIQWVKSNLKSYSARAAA